MGHAVIGLAAGPIEAHAGISLNFWQFNWQEALLIPALVLFATLVGLLPALTAYRTDTCKIPMTCNSDYDALQVAITMAGLEDPREYKLVWIKNTLELEKTIFRSDHASNYLVLKGTLNRDKPRLLEIVRTALEHPGKVALRPEWMRGL